MRPPRIPGFEVIGLLGRGGMGTVWRVRDAAGVERALKILSPSGKLRDADRNAQFRREALASMNLRHANIVEALDAGTSDGVRFVVFQLVEGESLAAAAARGPVPAQEVARVAAAVASALDHGHRLGLLHRDVKPSNILIAADGSVKLADFGLAALAGDRRAPPLCTRSYAAPEVLDGRFGDARSEIFSLGATIAAALAGPAGLRVADGRDRAGRQVELGSADPAATRLRLVAGRALDPDPDRRYRAMSEMLLDLEAVRDGDEPLGATLAARADRSGRGDVAGPRNRRVAIATVCGLALAAVAALRLRGTEGTRTDTGATDRSAAAPLRSGSGEATMSPAAAPIAAATAPPVPAGPAGGDAGPAAAASEPPAPDPLGESLDRAADELRRREAGSPTFDADLASAEALLTVARGEIGSGGVAVGRVAAAMARLEAAVSDASARRAEEEASQRRRSSESVLRTCRARAHAGGAAAARELIVVARSSDPSGSAARAAAAIAERARSAESRVSAVEARIDVAEWAGPAAAGITVYPPGTAPRLSELIAMDAMRVRRTGGVRGALQSVLPDRREAAAWCFVAGHWRLAADDPDVEELLRAGPVAPEPSWAAAATTRELLTWRSGPAPPTGLPTSDGAVEAVWRAAVFSTAARGRAASPKRRDSTLIARARDLYISSAYGEALEAVDRAVAADPSDPDGALLRSRILLDACRAFPTGAVAAECFAEARRAADLDGGSRASRAAVASAGVLLTTIPGFDWICVRSVIGAACDATSADEDGASERLRFVIPWHLDEGRTSRAAELARRLVGDAGVTGRDLLLGARAELADGRRDAARRLARAAAAAFGGTLPADSGIPPELVQER